MKIGIAVAVYKPVVEHFARQLQSILDQTHRNWVCALTLDSPLEELRANPRLKPFFEDARFMWSENTERLGVKKNFEAGIQLVLREGAQAIACSDQDDVWFEKKLATSVAELKKRPAMSLVHSDMQVSVGEDERVLPETAWQIEKRGVEFSKLQHFLVRNTVAGAAMLFDAELARMYPEIPEGVPYHDHWYALVASANGGVYPIREALYIYRQHGANVLGVTEYDSVFSTKTVGRAGILAKCREVYAFSKKLATATSRAHVLNSQLWKTVFLRRIDPGLGFAFMALANVGRDKPLVRACLARAVGKFLSVFSPSDR